MRRTAAAITVGLAGAVFIWIVTPCGNSVPGNAFISDGYMPPAALFVAMLLVSGVVASFGGDCQTVRVLPF